MMNGGKGGPHGGGDGEDDDDALTGAGAAAALAEADDESLMGLAVTVLAELKDRDLLRILLRNRTDAATLFEVEEIRGGEAGLEVVAAGFHAETPERYDGWVQEAAALHDRLRNPALSDEEAERILGRASDEALLLGLDRAQEEEDEAEEDGDEPAPDSAAPAERIGPRIAVELLRRGVIEDTDEADEEA